MFSRLGPYSNHFGGEDDLYSGNVFSSLLNEAREGAFLILSGRLFQSLIVWGKKLDFRDSVRHLKLSIRFPLRIGYGLRCALGWGSSSVSRSGDIP